MPVDPAAIDAWTKLGAFGFALVAIFLLYTRRVRTAGEATEDKAEADARLAEMRADRDRWRSIAEAYGDKLDSLTDVLEKLVADGAKLDRILALLDRLLRDVGRIIAKVVGAS